MFWSCRAARGRKAEDRVASSVVRKIGIGKNYEGRTRLTRSDISRFSGGTDGREFCELRLRQFGCGTPRPSVERFADSPNWDYVASFRRPRERVLRSVPSGRASGGSSMRTACGIFACSWLCEWLAVSRASVRLQDGADG